jgi:hypothetical protein
VRRFVVACWSIALMGAALALPAAGATNEVRPCGSSQGWEVNAGNFPPKLPQTKCSFARATDRALKEYERAKGELPSPLELSVNGQALTCRSKSSHGYAEIRCKSPPLRADLQVQLTRLAAIVSSRPSIFAVAPSPAS